MSVFPPSQAADGLRPSDLPTIDLLRVSGPLGVGDLSRSLEVTPTAVRQRLARLLEAGIVARSVVPAEDVGRGRSRGRPSHRFALTEKGRRIGGDNFRDLAMVLWKEVRDTADPAVRRGLLRRIGTGLAALVDGEVNGAAPAERLASAADVLRRRRVAVEFRPGDAAAPGDPATLVTYSCPYPGLAEADRGICAAERMMMEEVVGAPVHLAECRLDGGNCCSFALRRPADDTRGALPPPTTT